MHFAMMLMILLAVGCLVVCACTSAADSRLEDGGRSQESPRARSGAGSGFLASLQ